MASKVAPSDTQPVKLAKIDESASGPSPQISNRGAPTPPSRRGAPTPSMTRRASGGTASVRAPGESAPWRNAASVRGKIDRYNCSSVRGHDLETGDGVSVSHGQLAQARDRNFESAFSRCKEAIAGMSEHATAATFCRAAYADLMHTASNVLAMLRHMEAELHSDSKKTIVSLKHLCAQLELAKDECGIYLLSLIHI